MKDEGKKLQSLELIERLRSGERQVLREARWLMYLAVTAQENINLERLHSMEEKSSSYICDYVERTLHILDNLKVPEYISSLVEEVLIWSEVAKGGTDYFRRRWLKQGINLFVHNKGSAEIYLKDGKAEEREKHIIYTLISTHGLIGQYIRGEVSLKENKPLTELIDRRFVTKEELTLILTTLNHCIISAVDTDLWEQIEAEAVAAINRITAGDLEDDYNIRERLKRLRKTSVLNGEDFTAAYDNLTKEKAVLTALEKLLNNRDLWFVESALYDFTLEVHKDLSPYRQRVKGFC